MFHYKILENNFEIFIITRVKYMVFLIVLLNVLEFMLSYKVMNRFYNIRLKKKVLRKKIPSN